MVWEFRFRAAVAAEARATWMGRYRWLWAGLWAALLLLVAVTRQFDWLVHPCPPFLILCGLACWGPAWLCADLLSLRFRGNPEPHREWSPQEYLARALGRLGPFYTALTILVGVYCARALAHGLIDRNATVVFGQPKLERWADFPGWWAAWVAIFLFSGLPYAAGAALTSGAFRRPRRWLVTPLVVVLPSLGTVTLLTMDLNTVFELFTRWDQAAWFLGGPNYVVGYAAVLRVQQGCPVLFEAAGNALGAMPTICLLPTLGFSVVSLPLILAVWRVAAGRYRRHPFTPSQGMHASSALPWVETGMNVSSRPRREATGASGSNSTSAREG